MHRSDASMVNDTVKETNLHNYIDFNECTVNNGGCEQICVNQIASFDCRCFKGFMNESNGLNCTGMNYSILLLPTSPYSCTLIVYRDFQNFHCMSFVSSIRY